MGPVGLGGDKVNASFVELHPKNPARAVLQKHAIPGTFDAKAQEEAVVFDGRAMIVYRIGVEGSGKDQLEPAERIDNPPPEPVIFDQEVDLSAFPGTAEVASGVREYDAD